MLTFELRFTAIDKTARLAYNRSMSKPKDESFLCPHCHKRIPDELITKRSGRIGGKKTALRGSQYFREIAAKRKTFAGGRPIKIDATESK